MRMGGWAARGDAGGAKKGRGDIILNIKYRKFIQMEF